MINNLEPKEVPKHSNQRDEAQSSVAIDLDISYVSMHSDEQCEEQSTLKLSELNVIDSSDDFETENPTTSTSQSELAVCSEFDLSNWIRKSSTDQKLDILKRCWIPSQNYDFKKVCIGSSRRFIHKYLDTYKPWLMYTQKLKGALCLYCVLFPLVTVQGILGAFIVRPFTRYHDMHDACKNHASSKVNQISTKIVKNFMEAVPVDVQMVSGYRKLIEENQKIISSTISIIIFCGTHDLPLRAKHLNSGIFLGVN